MSDQEPGTGPWPVPDTGGPPTPPPPAPPPAAAGPGPAWGPPPPAAGAPGSSSRTLIGVLIGVIVLLVIGIVAAVVLLSGDDDDGDDAALTPAEVDDEGLFVDPQEQYAIELDPEWEQGPDVISGVESFLVAEPEGGFGPNLNVVAALDAPGVDEQGYVDAFIGNIDQFAPGAEVLDSGVVEGSDGRELGFVEYLADFGGPEDLHFLAIVDVADGGSASATLTAPPDRFDAIRADVEPYMLTIQRLDG